MTYRISATEARTRFDALMRRVVEEEEHAIVERGGKPYVVLLSYEEYERLRRSQAHPTWQETLDRLLRLGARIKARRGGRPLTPPEAIIREVREERDAQLSDLR